MSDLGAVLYLIVTVVVDVFVNHVWAALNANTSYLGWQIPTVIAYQHVIPLSVSAALAGILLANLSP